MHCTRFSADIAGMRFWKTSGGWSGSLLVCIGPSCFGGPKKKNLHYLQKCRSISLTFIAAFSTIVPKLRRAPRASKDKPMLPLLFLFTVTLVLLGRIYYQRRLTRRLVPCNWNDLCGKIEEMPHLALAHVGQEYLNPRPHQIAVEPWDIWIGLGGLEGIRRMRRNARVLIALAAYAERWNFTESVIVRERMRRDALQLRRAIFQLTVRRVLHVGQLRIPFHLHESVAAYHLMTKRLLMLYQHSHAGLYPRLVQVLGDGSTIAAHAL